MNSTDYIFGIARSRAAGRRHAPAFFLSSKAPTRVLQAKGGVAVVSHRN